MNTEQRIRSPQRRVHELLSSPNPDGLTRMQIALCLGIERASVCRRVAELRDKGQIWIVKNGLDPTSNPDVAAKVEAERAVKQDTELTGRLF